MLPTSDQIIRTRRKERELTHVRHLPATYLPYTAEHGIPAPNYQRSPTPKPSFSIPPPLLSATSASGPATGSRRGVQFLRPAVREALDLVAPPSPARGLQRRKRRRRALSTPAPRRCRRAGRPRLPVPPRWRFRRAAPGARSEHGRVRRLGTRAARARSRQRPRVLSAPHRRASHLDGRSGPRAGERGPHRRALHVRRRRSPSPSSGGHAR